jgi:hypothetical protein
MEDTSAFTYLLYHYLGIHHAKPYTYKYQIMDKGKVGLFLKSFLEKLLLYILNIVFQNYFILYFQNIFDIFYYFQNNFKKYFAQH